MSEQSKVDYISFSAARITSEVDKIHAELQTEALLELYGVTIYTVL